MTRSSCLSLTMVLLLVGSVAFGQETEAILERAIECHGGGDLLTRPPHLKKTGLYERSGSGRTSDLVIYQRSDGGFRAEITFDFRGRKMTMVEIYDGAAMHKRKWSTTWDDLPLDEVREEAKHRLGFLVAARQGDLESAGSGTEGGVAVDYLKVPDGRGVATLALSQEDGCLVALEYPGTEASGMGTKEEVLRKIVYRDFWEVGGLRLARDEEHFKDGQPDGRIRYEDIEVLDEFDPTWLKVPDPTIRFIPSEELIN